MAAGEPDAAVPEPGGGNRLRSILESAADHAIVAAGPDGRITGWWGGSSRLLGWAEAEALGRDLAALYTPEDRDAGVPEAEMREARERGYTEEERRHVRRDGSRFWGNGELRPIRDGAGAVVGYLKIMRDGTARRMADGALREAARERERMVAMLSHSQTLVCGWDGRVEAWTQGMERLFGYAPAEAMGMFARELLHSEFPEPWPAVVAALRRDGRWQGQVRHQHKDGAARFAQESWAIQPGLDGGVASLMAAVEDQTAVKRAEEALREANATLEARVEARTAELMAAEATLRQSQKMEAIGQLTGGIAHDFNNVLQGITGNLDLLRLRAEQGRPGSVVRHLAGAHKSVGCAAALTRRLLAFARQLPLDPTLASLDKLATGMEELIRRTMGPSVQVELRLGDGSWLVLCDEGQLENALLNLAINVRDAMAQPSPGGSVREAGARPEGGWLTISTGEAHLSAADLAGEDGTAPGAFATIAVTDTGAGMAPEVMARAFEPFFTTKPLGRGTGLGLSQTYGFVRQSGGVVRLESAPGRGTTVRIFLPRHEPAPAEDLGENEGAGDVVLLVEDEDGLRQSEAEWLRELGYRVLEAPDGAAALRLLDGGGRVDVLVADLGLPGGLDGRQVADAARGRRPGLPVLFMTGYAEAGAAVPGAETIGKPFPLEVLAERIGTVLEAARSVRGLTAILAARSSDVGSGPTSLKAP